MKLLLLEIIPSSENPIGKVIVTDVYDRISRSQVIGDFAVQAGDLAILKE